MYGTEEGATFPTYLLEIHPLAVFSGMEISAEDLVVQCCAFLCNWYGRDMVVLMSGAELGSRCRLQTGGGLGGEVVPSEVSVSVIGSNGGFGSKYVGGGGGGGGEESMEELRPRVVEREEEDKEEVDGQVTEDLNKWIDPGRPGLEIGRVTKGGG